ncbi:MAG TPA: DUF5989 family protein [Vicinamibacterales bacterium]|jgi:hypothetical protein
MTDSQIVRALWAFLKSEKDFALASIAVVLVVLGTLLVSFAGRGFAPFVYAGF